ncbi:MAG: carbon monoxide dehydrogenase [Oscillospiraceae bacterium]|nr:carbon monoxide dehydrogenase [Oscillospiraceae bacterium]
MKLYDGILQKTDALFSALQPARFAYDPRLCWEDTGASELVLLRDAGCELGGLGSVNYTCVTTSDALVPEDGIAVYGQDLPSLRGENRFARIVLLSVDNPGDDEDAYQAIRKLEFVRYHVFPKGYLVRVSSESNQEQVRVSKQALKAGISFRRVGASYLQKYRELPGVRHVRLIFAVNPPFLPQLTEYARQVDAITSTLTHILDGIPTDCGHCSMKPVCDEVEGMRELHLGKKK